MVRDWTPAWIRTRQNRSRELRRTTDRQGCQALPAWPPGVRVSVLICSGIWTGGSARRKRLHLAETIDPTQGFKAPHPGARHRTGCNPIPHRHRPRDQKRQKTALLQYAATRGHRGDSGLIDTIPMVVLCIHQKASRVSTEFLPSWPMGRQTRHPLSNGHAHSLKICYDRRPVFEPS